MWQNTVRTIVYCILAGATLSSRFEKKKKIYVALDKDKHYQGAFSSFEKARSVGDEVAVDDLNPTLHPYTIVVLDPAGNVLDKREAYSRVPKGLHFDLRGLNNRQPVTIVCTSGGRLNLSYITDLALDYLQSETRTGSYGFGERKGKLVYGYAHNPEALNELFEGRFFTSTRSFKEAENRYFGK